MVYYDESVLLTLAKAIGVPVRVDINIETFVGGKLVMVCVEVDLSKLVIGKV